MRGRVIEHDGAVEVVEHSAPVGRGRDRFDRQLPHAIDVVDLQAGRADPHVGMLAADEQQPEVGCRWPSAIGGVQPFR